MSPPVLAVVGREVDPALVVADPAVVLARDQVGRIGRVVDDLLLGLAPESAVLVHALVALALVAARAADRAGAGAGRVAGDAEVLP
jgi:hypothetical protein